MFSALRFFIFKIKLLLKLQFKWYFSCIIFLVVYNEPIKVIKLLCKNKLEKFHIFIFSSFLPSGEVNLFLFGNKD